MPMPKGTQPESGPFARALSAEVRAAIARQRSNAKELALKSGMSESYLGKRLRDQAPLNANDIEKVCRFLGEDLLSIVTAAASKLGPERRDA